MSTGVRLGGKYLILSFKNILMLKKKKKKGERNPEIPLQNRVVSNRIQLKLTWGGGKGIFKF